MPGRGYDLWFSDGDYPAWQGRPQRSLIVCTQHRSGSSLLGEAIHFSGGLGCPVEYFHRGVRPIFEQRWQTGDLPSYLDALYRLRTAPTGIFAVKMVWFDIVDIVREVSPGEFDMLRDDGEGNATPETYRHMLAVMRAVLPNPTWIHLIRRNTVEQAISHFVAWQTRAWHQFSGREPGEDAPARPPLDFDQICQTLARIQNVDRHWANFFTANALSQIEIAYEDISQHYDATLRRFFADVGQPDAPITPPRLQKQANAHSQILLQQFSEEFRRRARG